MFLTILLTGFIAYSQKTECSKFKDIKFYSPAHPSQYCVRKDSIEETYTDNKLDLIWSIKWLSDCKYEKVCTKNFGSEPVKPGDKFLYTIFATEDDCFYVNISYTNEKYPDGDTFQRGLCLKK